jgi:hypothetical protein
MEEYILVFYRTVTIVSLLTIVSKVHTSNSLKERVLFYLFFGCSMNSGPHTCQAGTLSLKPLHQSLSCDFFFSGTICPGLALNHNPPDLCFLSSFTATPEQA